MNSDSYSILDEALEILKPYGPEFRGGLSNHGPMATEALCALGRGDAVIAWVDEYRKHLEPRPTPHDRIARADWRAALGDQARVADWMAFFAEEIEEQGWQEVLKLWVPRFTPGLIAAATHGAIRTGHAARGLAHRDTPERRHELAQGLGYWAATFAKLPEREARTTALRPSQAISKLTIFPVDQRHNFGLITHALAQLDSFAPFADAANLADTSGNASEFISDLTATFARAYLANAKNVLGAIVFIHSVTGPSALRPILPYQPPDATVLALRYAWQAASALFCTYGIRPAPEG